MSQSHSRRGQKARVGTAHACAPPSCSRRDRLPPVWRLVSQKAGLRDSAGRGQAMATADPDGHAAPSIPGPRPSGTGAAGLPSGRSGIGAPRLGERIPAAVEKRGPYMVARAPSIQAKLSECGRMREGSLLGRAAAFPGWLRSAAGATPEGQLQPAPAPENLFGERAPGVWETRRNRDEPADLGPLTSREAPGPGQGGSAEKRHAGGRAEPPRLFREKVSAGATSSVQAFSQ